jgi:hypothetical protein
MKTRTHPVSPSELLCAIFVLSQRAGRVDAMSMRDLRISFGVAQERLDAPLELLRGRGLVQDGVPRLTFLGLATALQILPATTWADWATWSGEERACA